MRGSECCTFTDGVLQVSDSIIDSVHLNVMLETEEFTFNNMTFCIEVCTLDKTILFTFNLQTIISVFNTVSFI